MARRTVSKLFQIDLVEPASLLAAGAIHGAAGVFFLPSPCIVDLVRDPEIVEVEVNGIKQKSGVHKKIAGILGEQKLCRGCVSTCASSNLKISSPMN
ncbi:hypothetical protein J5N97_002232 [Dioscorea zingiberensis]|uniref:Uncharacterized protein n=1 Tax=Dioscorea zingiberensis TaxID=325984 RepID=A0A9D5D2C0_9LILI|nr:hypothetical protein J5N97_002232 [Dioscorea zingiberensis]